MQVTYELDREGTYKQKKRSQVSGIKLAAMRSGTNVMTNGIHEIVNLFWPFHPCGRLLKKVFRLPSDHNFAHFVCRNYTTNLAFHALNLLYSNLRSRRIHSMLF